MNAKQLRQAMRSHKTFRTENGLVSIKPNICERTFVVYVGNQYNINVCAKYIGRECYRQFHGGQMEQVLDDLICISYIRTPAEALNIVHELRKLGIIGTICLEAEYVQGYPVSVKTY